jgi:hypothetical protein
VSSGFIQASGPVSRVCPPAYLLKVPFFERVGEKR